MLHSYYGANIRIDEDDSFDLVERLSRDHDLPNCLTLTVLRDPDSDIATRGSESPQRFLPAEVGI